MNQSTALLVDGDNIGSKRAGEVMRQARKFGTLGVARVYFNAKGNSGWHDTYGFELVHRGPGKNAADMLLCVDAMELALRNGFQKIVVASSDSDFRHLAERLRFLGVEVLGVGEEKAPTAYRASCTRFVELKDRTACDSKTSKPSETDLKIRNVIEKNDGGNGILLTELNQHMHRMGIKISTFPEKRWRPYFSERPSLYDLDPKGPEQRVRLRKDGFNGTALTT